MIKPVSSLFSKILCWFFLNLVLVAASLVIFFSFHSQINLYALFGQHESNRLRSAAMLISYDLNQAPRENWSNILARHAKSHQVDFKLVLKDGFCVSSGDEEVPDTIMTKVKAVLSLEGPRGRFPRFHAPPGEPEKFHKSHGFDIIEGLVNNPPVRKYPPFSENPSMEDHPPMEEHPLMEEHPPMKKHPPIKKHPPMDKHPPVIDDSYLHPGSFDKKHQFKMHTRRPDLYWAGIRIPLFTKVFAPPVPAVLLAVSDSITGNGFFFDPFPWMIAAFAVIFISVMFWIPMVRNITLPLVRMTRATEEIAKGCFDVTIHEPRGDEIGRLAKAINHMTSRLSAFVKGQKRFLGDVAHELGSPIARIHFGLAVLKERSHGETQDRVMDIMEDVENMSGLVNELLAFSRAEMNKTTIRLEKMELLPVVQAAVKREAASAEQIIIQIDPGLHVFASAELLTRAIANLIRNAFKYAGEMNQIHIFAEKRKNEVSIEVQDAGPGVPGNLINELFEPFFRPEPSRDRDSGGVGLGLAIVKTCIETCKGSVSARNLKPNGFAVTIVLKS